MIYETRTPAQQLNADTTMPSGWIDYNNGKIQGAELQVQKNSYVRWLLRITNGNNLQLIVEARSAKTQITVCHQIVTKDSFAKHLQYMLDQYNLSIPD